MAKPIQELSLLISEFPGIGPRQARRIVQFLLTKTPTYREKFSSVLSALGKETEQCVSCFRFDDSGNGRMCTICANGERDHHVLMVVEKDADIENIEHSRAYHGMYFVLGGHIPMTERKNPPYVRTKELEEKIRKNGIIEIILALSTTPEGDFTARELMNHYKELFPNVKCTLLGRGLSVGAEIEYADAETLRNALKNRT
ncbi:toprim domain-containing protein [Patescibacteria group bacterium]|nr:toprim domain-containing protein [Patescibacteria group bacterium]